MLYKTKLSYSRTSDGKFYKRKRKKHRKNDNDVMSASFDAIAIFPTYGQFGAIPKPDFRCIVCKTYSFTYSNIVTFYLTKTGNRISNRTLTLSL